MADWEEVKRLAADFQKVQLSSTTQKLSERNCIEIVSWLLEKKIIDLIFTSDGKEYLTPQQLVTDIQNELYVAGGRINIGELAKAIGVDYGHITGHLNEVLRTRKDIQHILGQLIDSTYITKIAGEINEKLQQQGSLNVGELTITYDLPAEFLQQQVLEKHLGTLIFGKQDSNDPKVFFTESFIARSKAKLKGALAGITKPTPVVSILSQTGMSEKLFFSLFDQTSMFGALTSRIAGAQYIPNCYTRSQNEWTTNFYKQNGYLEFDALTRLGIQDYKNYLKKQFSNEDFLFLETSVASKRILERLEAHIDECISSKSYVDLQNVLPSVFTSKDVSLIVDKLLTPQKQVQTLILEDYILSKAFMDNMASSCQDLVASNAKKLVEVGKYQQYLVDLQGTNKGESRSHKSDDFEDKIDKREERRKKAAGGNKGGGTQGRETKTKSTKKHFRGGQKNASEDFDESAHTDQKKVLQVVTCVEIKEVIEKELENEGLDTLVDPIAEYLGSKLNEQGLQIAADIFKTTVADQNANRRKTHNELQEKLNDLISEIRLFSKGIKLLPTDLQNQLNKYLLKTIATDIVTEVLNYAAQESMTNTQTDKFNQDQRLKFVNELPDTFKPHVLPLVKSLTAQALEDFMASVDPALAACSMIIKKIDKKKDRTIVLNHKHKLLEELNVCEDVALVLHLATLIIFISATQCMLHASGRHVSAILNYLKPSLTAEQYSELMAYHDFITLMLSNGSEAENAKEKLKEKKDLIKQIASEFKLSSGGDKTNL
ncbi:E3 UFM1-protein ligase 1 homolog [Anthonomus grandis grandis]|uniref:E3 UFM1-protein ligase 1 homolog n=1 Tax=Anthonomus grandis grandis TaxID=2921223 RepID=UPI0021661D4D|nr:E3 UFM1-protein ligase 1 homolog [Anthonomus grandis grandis]